MKITDSQFLRSDQYRDSRNLTARASLHQRFSTNPRGWFHWMLDQIELSPGMRILEVGAGPGILWQAGRERLPDGCRLVISDLSAGMLFEARQAILEGPGHFDYTVVDAQAIPFPSGVFDLVLANYMLYHVPDRPRALREIRRVLRPDGRLYAATNGQNHLRQLRLLGNMTSDTLPERAAAWPASGFDLQNGADQLRAVFSQVELRCIDDALAITEAEPVLAYLKSMWEDLPALQQPDGEQRIRAYIEKEIRLNGAFNVTKESGIFISHG